MTKGEGARKIFSVIKRNSPTILSCIAVAGVFGTIYLSIKATSKACKLIEEKKPKTKVEIVKTVYKTYIPTALMGFGSIACIVGANILNRKQQASLISAYASLNSGLQLYSHKLKELYGEEAHDKVLKDISIEPKNVVETNSYTIFDEEDENELLFCEMLSPQLTPRYFKATPSFVLSAFIEMNRIFNLGGTPSLNKLYELLNLQQVEGGDMIGWDVSDGFYFIDFEIIPNELDDGMKYYIIHAPVGPEIIESFCFN